MSKKTQMNKAIELVKQRLDEDAFTGPVPESKIQQVSKELKITFPESMKLFLSILGTIEDHGFMGIDLEFEEGGILPCTKWMREEYNLPDQYLVFWSDEGSEDYKAIDCSVQNSDGESPVYSFHTYTEDPTSTMEKVSDSFEGYFCSYFNLPIEE